METFKSDLIKSQSPKLMKQRTCWAFLTTLARPCTVSLTDKTTHQGIIHTFCKNGITLCTKSDSDRIKIPIEKIVSVQCNGIQTLNKSKFKTDQEISKQARTQKRTLQQWECEDSSNLNFDMKEYKPYDQFEINKHLFGVVSTYDENLYTTPVPKLSELTEEQVHRAKMVEKELGVCSVEKEENEMDEEAQFGAVLGSGRYESSKKSSGKKVSKKGDENKAEPFTGKKFINTKKNSQVGLNVGLGVSEEVVKESLTSVVGHFLTGWNSFFKKD